MFNNVTVVTGTFGDESWIDLVKARAAKSVSNQSCVPEYVHIHADNLADARNQGALQASKDFLCFLDADDFLDVNYIENMNAAISQSADGFNTLFQPATKTFQSIEKPVLIPHKPLLSSNFLIIGTIVSKEMFLNVGGFDSSLSALEDWDLWIRSVINGCSVTSVSSAIYEISHNENSRNTNSNNVYSKIRSKYLQNKKASSLL